MATFLGYTIMHPATPGWEDDSEDARAGGVEQVSTGGMNKRYTLAFDLEAETEVEASGAQMVLMGHKNRYGTGRAFDFDWFQGLGIEPPAAATFNGGKAIGAKEVVFSVAVPVGAFFQVSGARPLYQIAEAGTGRTRYIEPALVNAVTNGAAVDFTPTVRVKHRAGSGLTFGTNDHGIAVPRVSLIEARTG